MCLIFAGLKKLQQILEEYCLSNRNARNNAKLKVRARNVQTTIAFFSPSKSDGNEDAHKNPPEVVQRGK